MNKFALIGNPLTHSLSPVIHQAGFKSLGIDAEYELIETDDLVTTIKQLKSGGFSGFNVTIPYKLPVAMFVDKIEPSADFARAVNTVKIETDKTLSAYNTVIIGFQNTLADVSLQGKRAAILGTGGAAHAVVAALALMKVKEITFFTRSIPNALDKLNFMRKKFEDITFHIHQIEKIGGLSEFAILVNATPIGMLGNSADMQPVSRSALSTMGADAIVYDLIYNPRKTLLIKDAEKLGLKTINGLDMLVHQAAAAQEIWFNDAPAAANTAASTTAASTFSTAAPALRKKPSIPLMKLAALEELA